MDTTAQSANWAAFVAEKTAATSIQAADEQTQAVADELAYQAQVNAAAAALTEFFLSKDGWLAAQVSKHLKGSILLGTTGTMPKLIGDLGDYYEYRLQGGRLIAVHGPEITNPSMADLANAIMKTLNIGPEGVVPFVRESIDHAIEKSRQG